MGGHLSCPVVICGLSLCACVGRKDGWRYTSQCKKGSASFITIVKRMLKRTMYALGLSQICFFLVNYSIPFILSMSITLILMDIYICTTMTPLHSHSDDDKILLLCPSAVSFSNLDPELGTANVNSSIVFVALLIATDSACVATIF